MQWMILNHQGYLVTLYYWIIHYSCHLLLSLPSRTYRSTTYIVHIILFIHLLSISMGYTISSYVIIYYTIITGLLLCYCGLLVIYDLTTISYLWFFSYSCSDWYPGNICTLWIMIGLLRASFYIYSFYTSGLTIQLYLFVLLRYHSYSLILWNSRDCYYGEVVIALLYRHCLHIVALIILIYYIITMGAPFISSNSLVFYS